MASSHDTVSMALFCDFENVALGVRDAKYEKFDIKRVLERLLLKGSIVVKKAYCDWERYKGFKATMHEASFELIEIPHVRQSGKNSADIRLVVDALDLCYTKSHVNTFVIISGDSDFSPLVSKLRENAKQVIGVGVKQSTSDLLIANCDEFIFYDDLVRESERAAAKPDTREAQPAAKRSPDEEKRGREEQEKRKTQAVELAVETFDALVAERGDSGKIWASLLKEAIKRRKPGFNESYYGFRAFGNLLEEAQARGLLDLGRDEKSGAYVYRRNGSPIPAAVETSTRPDTPAATPGATVEEGASRSGNRRPRGRQAPAEQAVSSEPAPTPDVEIASPPGQLAETERITFETSSAEAVTGAPAATTERSHRAGRRGHGRKPTRTASGEPTADTRGPAVAADGQPSAAPAVGAPATPAPTTAAPSAPVPAAPAPTGPTATAPAPAAPAPTITAPAAESPTVAAEAPGKSESRATPSPASPVLAASPVGTAASPTDGQQFPGKAGPATTPAEAVAAEPKTHGRPRRARKPAAPKAEQAAGPEPTLEAPRDAGSASATPAATADASAPQRKATRPRRPRKVEATPDEG